MKSLLKPFLIAFFLIKNIALSIWLLKRLPLIFIGLATLSFGGIAYFFTPKQEVCGYHEEVLEIEPIQLNRTVTIEPFYMDETEITSSVHIEEA